MTEVGNLGRLHDVQRYHTMDTVQSRCAAQATFDVQRMERTAPGRWLFAAYIRASVDPVRAPRYAPMKHRRYSG